MTRGRGPTRRTRHETTHWLNDPTLPIDITKLLSPHRPPGKITRSQGHPPILLPRTVHTLLPWCVSPVHALPVRCWCVCYVTPADEEKEKESAVGNRGRGRRAGARGGKEGASNPLPTLRQARRTEGVFDGCNPYWHSHRTPHTHKEHTASALPSCFLFVFLFYII